MSDVEHHTASWHEARAADLLRDDEQGRPAAQGPTERAKAHARIATSMRLGDLTRAVKEADRHAQARARAEARRSR